jgi:cytochrome P450
MPVGWLCRRCLADICKRAALPAVPASLQARGPPAEDDTDIGSQLVRVMNTHPELSRDRILSEIGILFVEGFETTGHTTSWTLFNIASDPGVQSKIAEELDSLGLLAKPGCPPPRELEWEDLKHMPYLTACAKEAMRMLPVVSVMGREPTKPTQVGPYTIPAGTIVGTPLFVIQNTIHNWDKPEVFDPDRWLSVPIETYVYNSKDSHTPGDMVAAASSSKRGITFMPFSEGPRNCVGQVGCWLFACVVAENWHSCRNWISVHLLISAQAV